jgi:tetratricopeptide (TPR) repeat protein
LDPAGFELGISKYNLAKVLSRCNQLDGAEAEHQSALALFNNNDRTLYAHVHRSAVDLARVYRAQGKCDVALELLRRALATHDDELFFPGAAFAELLDEISETLVEKGDSLGAEQISRFTLMCWEQLFGEGHPDLYPRFLRLASIEETLERTKEAGAMRARAATIGDQASNLDLSALASKQDPDARLYEGNGRYLEQPSLAERILIANAGKHGSQHLSVAEQLVNVSKYYALWWKYTDEWRYADAIQHCKRAIKIRENIQGSDHLDLARCLDCLGDVYANYSEAGSKYGPLYERALLIRENALGPKHPDVATSLINVARKYGNMPTVVGDERRESEQYPLFRRALAIREEAYGAEHPATADSLEEITDLASNHDESIDERAVFERILKVREQALGFEHPEVWRTLSRLTRALQDDCEYHECRKLLERQLDFQEQVLGPEHPDTASTLETLAEIAVAEDAVNYAIDLYRRALSIREALPLSMQFNRFGDGDIRSSLGGLAGIFMSQERFDEAEVLYLRLLSTLEAHLSSTDPELGGVLRNLTDLYFKQQKWDAAEPLYERLLEVWKNVHWIGNLDESVPEGLANLALIYQAKDKRHAAEDLYQHAIGIWEKRQNIGELFFRKDLMEVAVSLFDAKGRDVENDPLQDESLALLHRAPAEERVGITTCLQNYATLLTSMGREEEASTLERLAQELTETVKDGKL